MKFIRSILICMILLLSLGRVCSAVQNNIKFTQAEKEFIKLHPVIHLGVDPKFIPYEFIDSDGVYKGIAADYIKLLSEETGLKFEVEKGLLWSEAYEKGVLKQLDALPCVSKTKEREQYFLYSEPYYSFQRVIYINENNKTIKDFNDLQNLKIAVQIDSSHYSYLKTFKSIRLSPYTTVEDALRAVADGREIAFVGNLATSNYLIKSNGITNLKYVKIQSQEEQSLYFAVRNDWPLLVSIINKGLAGITEAEKINIDNQWIGVENKIDYGAIIKIAGIIGIVLAIIFIVSLYWIVKLKKEVKIRKRTEAALKISKEEAELARAEAELANHIKSTFLARMSHEIRTPLNAITGMSYVIKKTGITSTQKIYLEKITRAARDMLAIINDILDFSKIEAGKIDIERIPFNLDEVIAALINIISFKIEEQKIDFSLNKDTDIPTFFFGDPKRIQQVLLNVVNNAVKFTKDGAVSLSIRLVAKTKDSYVLQFSVKDTGIGMSGEQLKQLFTPFNQADPSISRRFGGTGLGLSIVKNLVEMMGGSVEVYSALDEGSTFNIQLTLEADQNKDYEERKKSASIYFQNIRVLVVEKSAFYTNLLKDYLSSFNIVAEFATSENRALQLIENASRDTGKPYNLLIVDYETPKDGGIEFCAKIKLLSSIVEVPKCIIMVPLSKEELFEEIEMAGLDFGITKPIIPSILYNGIVEIFKINILEIYDDSTLNSKQETFISPYPYHVLIVEDNKTNQFIAKSILEQSGFKVSLTDNGREGYEFFLNSQGELDLILMDLHMPVMNGLEATELIRKADKNIPIIAMTADAITGVEEKCKSVGINHYISKPFDPDQFVETIYQVIKPFKEDSSRRLGDKEENEEETNDNTVMLDEGVGIRHMGGNEALFSSVLSEYYNENKDIHLILSSTMENHDYKEAIQIVHKIKSSSGSIGANLLYDIASKFQISLSKEDDMEILELHKKFEKTLKQLLLEIEQRIFKNKEN